MAIKKRTYSVYYIECDGCGAHGPEASFDRTAHVLAKDDGYQLEERHNGLEIIQRWYCPFCIISRDANA